MISRAALGIYLLALLAAGCANNAPEQASGPETTQAPSKTTRTTAAPSTTTTRAATSTTQQATTTIPPTTSTTTPAFDRSRYSIDEPGSLWWIVGRERPLPDNYAPSNLSVPNVRSTKPPSSDAAKISTEATSAADEMFDAAAQDGVRLVLLSGYRSQATQAAVFERLKARTSLANAEKYSARPGTSEHQTGLSMDITSLSAQCQLKPCFEQTPEAIWLLENAYRYGFHLRYRKGFEEITGYPFEPWHYRYVGVELATELYESSLTMEEFFGLQEIEKPLE